MAYWLLSGAYRAANLYYNAGSAHQLSKRRLWRQCSAAGCSPFTALLPAYHGLDGRYPAGSEEARSISTAYIS